MKERIGQVDAEKERAIVVVSTRSPSMVIPMSMSFQARSCTIESLK